MKIAEKEHPKGMSDNIKKQEDQLKKR